MTGLGVLALAVWSMRILAAAAGVLVTVDNWHTQHGDEARRGRGSASA